MSPEEIGQYRATAQQKSIDAIKAAEQRYVNANAIRLGGLKTPRRPSYTASSNHNLPFCKSAQAKDPPLTGLALSLSTRRRRKAGL
ncbi:hypothetical protein HPP92_008621 [Vanilla planifolia]|uniref:Uncharacterized protein n=1 Tax=Vanilla planifolia TaxID=51239 RepID=A0A835REN4_VANPL|nr:hypothetical protein HPP92_008621 [Vanilla planifolia]